jgi:hypothetical protein
LGKAFDVIMELSPKVPIGIRFGSLPVEYLCSSTVTKHAVVEPRQPLTYVLLGVSISEIDPSSPFAEVGLQVGDVLHRWGSQQNDGTFRLDYPPATPIAEIPIGSLEADLQAMICPRVVFGVHRRKPPTLKFKPSSGSRYAESIAMRGHVGSADDDPLEITKCSLNSGQTGL